MKFSPDQEQEDFARALDALLSSADTVAAARAWAGDDFGPGSKLWRRVAGLGVTALLIPEESNGIGGTLVDVAVVFERLGYHGIPGPWIESAVFLPALLNDSSETSLRTRLAEGLIATSSEPDASRALDVRAADCAFTVTGNRMFRAQRTDDMTSVDPVRRLGAVEPGEPVCELDAATVIRAFDAASLACASMLLGAGQRLLADTVAYVLQRRQFGRVVGGYQAVKHMLADVEVSLDFTRPLVIGAAHEWTANSTTVSRDVSAAKVAAGNAAYLAARAALQLHGAVAYTLELDVSMWILRVQALETAWGTSAYHRGRIAAALREG
ncbi:acyl-CoA dehydrogenase family protein [Rhodococcus sovatensis]|uniref:Acyl-CoA dehydrogenase family protein n=1 Tax=Rhodococcus sovatensis TaxID=1805840 RepID=A0ABZ2PQK7_9NOCA